MNHNHQTRRIIPTLWLAGLLFGVLLVLLLLISAWWLRAVTPGVASIRISTLETGAPIVPQPVDPTPLLQSSFDEVQANKERLMDQLSALKRDLESKLEQCRPPALPVDRWANKDLGILEGCWDLGKEAPIVRGGSNSAERETCTSKVGRICFDQSGRGQREQTMSCPRAGVIFCSASVTAKFGADGGFQTLQPDVDCQRGSATKWHSRTLTCHRVGDDHAVCRDSGRPELGLPAQDQEFRRAQ